MRTNRSHALSVVALSLASLIVLDRPVPTPPPATAASAMLYPGDWFGQQRAFPLDSIPQQRWLAALEHARVERAAVASDASSPFAVNAGLLTWQMAGPTNIGGRIAAIVAAPSGNPAYFGAANGGVFRSSDFGSSWSPVFDALGVPSIGALAMDPLDANVVYVGTGESNTAIDNYDGNGLYRTRNGGLDWEHLGLAATARIARVAVDPSDPSVIHVAAMGTQFSTGPDRGFYRSTDAGLTWTRTLFVNDSTGVCDVVINPAHPETVFCATWERVRRPTARRAEGPGCGIWRSADRGASWTRLAGGLPTPSDSVGRIGLAIAPSRPSMIYAQIITGRGLGYVGRGLYRSTDGGSSWARRDVSGFTGGFGGFGWYFGDCAVDPTNSDIVYSLGLNIMRSTNGGVNFSSVSSGVHVDQHALWISKVDPMRMYSGNDGGFYTTTNGASTWAFASGLPITQFYAGAIDPSNPARLLGGTQDNNTLLTNGPANAWNAILGGDGFYCLVDHTNPSVIFAEYQNASGGTGPQRSGNGGASFSTPAGFVTSDRYNWNAPFVMDPVNHNILIAGSQRVYKSVNNGLNWTPVSGDLSTNPASQLNYGTITTLDISAADGSFYLAGTDDGRVWRSTNAGANWVEITSGLPRRWVSRVVADPTNPNTCYVTLSGFTQDEHVPHVFRSLDRGANWSGVGGNLPDAPVNDLVVDPAHPGTWFAATDVGAWATRNHGAGWFPLGQGMPLQTVHDLSFHASSRSLVAATHGRSQWRLDLNELPVAVETPSSERLEFTSSGPNPFRSAAGFTIAVSRSTSITVAIYDASGRRVRTLGERSFAPGRHALTWNGDDARGRSMPAGVYFARASADGWSSTRRLVRVE